LQIIYLHFGVQYHHLIFYDHYYAKNCLICTLLKSCSTCPLLYYNFVVNYYNHIMWLCLFVPHVIVAHVHDRNMFYLLAPVSTTMVACVGVRADRLGSSRTNELEGGRLCVNSSIAWVVERARVRPWGSISR